MQSYGSFLPQATAWQLADVRGTPEKCDSAKRGFMFEFHLAATVLDDDALSEMHALVASLTNMPFYENAARFVVNPAPAARRSSAGEAGDD